MIKIAGQTADPQALAGLTQGAVEQAILQMMLGSDRTYEYASAEELGFELSMRRATVDAARALDRSGMGFEIFRKTECNPAFWRRTEEGGFVLRDGVKPSQAIRDIFQNGPKYATECATAIMIVYYRAVLEVFSDELFDKTFPKIELMNWHHIDPLFRSIGYMRPVKDYLPGDRMYFMNPDVNPKTPEWQGENVIVLGNDSFYGHGIGIENAHDIIAALNENRVRNASESAYLIERAGWPDYKRLFKIKQGAQP